MRKSSESEQRGDKFNYDREAWAFNEPVYENVGGKMGFYVMEGAQGVNRRSTTTSETHALRL